MSGLTPIPGDPDFVAQKASRYLSIADSIRSTTQKLREISRMDNVRSEAIEALRERAETTAESIERAQGRYRGTAEALAVYAPLHRQYQDDAAAAIAEYTEAQEGAARAAQLSVENAASADQAGPSQKADEKRAAYYDELSMERYGAANAAYARYVEARERWEAAAATAVSGIDAAIDESGLNNSLWRNIVTVIKTIGEIAAVAAIFLSWVPILGPILTAIAIVGAIVSLIDGIVALMQTGDWGAFAGTALSSLLGLFGGGIIKFLGKGITMASHTGKLTKMKVKKFEPMMGQTRAQFRQENSRTLGAFFRDSVGIKKADFGMVAAGSGTSATRFNTQHLKADSAASFREFWLNPLGTKGPHYEAIARFGGDPVPRHLTIGLDIMDARTVLGKAETLSNVLLPDDAQIALKPDSILKQELNRPDPVLVVPDPALSPRP